MTDFFQNALAVGGSILPLVITLGVLVFVHELGHFLFAKRAGVKVLKFSIGFGPRIFGWTRGETEYVVSWLPLGGYVKMLGENPGEEIPAEDRNRTLTSKPLLDKLLIVFAGPGMNLVLPILIFFVVFMTGFPGLTSTIGTITPGSEAARAGIAPGDRIVSIAGKPVRWWEEVAEALDAGQGKPLDIVIGGKNGEREVTLTPKSRSVENLLGDRERIGDIGVSPGYEPALAAVSRADSPAWKAGVRTGDLVTSLNGRRVVRREEIGEALAGRVGPQGVTTRRAGRERIARIVLPAAVAGPAAAAAAGFEAPEFFISSVEKHAPAGEAGLRVGDRLVSIDGKPVSGWIEFTGAVRGSRGKTLALTVRRDGAEQVLRVTPGRRFNADPLSKERRVYYIGVGTFSPASGVVASRRVLNPVKAFGLGLREAWHMSVMTFRGMGKLVTGAVRIDNIGGPIQIGKVAADAAEDGLYTFLRMMAFISINLGILNLIPIPILDGGHLLFFVIEAVKREPISVRKKEMAQQVGLTMLLLLIGVAFYNDIARSWDQIVGFLKDVRLRFM